MGRVPDRVRGRFWSLVDVRDPAECWDFQLSTGRKGYGQVGFAENGIKQNVLAHRLAYVLAKGPIPDGLTVDHLCRRRKCCNPAHLRLLTSVENSRRNGNELKTHCPSGHPYSPENTYVSKRGDRQCRICRREAVARYERRRRSPRTKG